MNIGYNSKNIVIMHSLGIYHKSTPTDKKREKKQNTINQD